jgi:hypothetical protein
MDRDALEYWIPAFAGMTAECAATACHDKIRHDKTRHRPPQ